MDYIEKNLDYGRDTIVINPKDLSRGHISLKTAFTMKGNPKENAEKLKKEVEKNKMVEKVSTAGPYVNVWMKDEFYMDYLKWEFNSKNKKRVLIEFVSANPNKPLHLGHLRNMVLGESISRIYEFLGYDVVRMNYINDMGLQFAQIVWDLNKNPYKVDEKFDFYLGKKYIDIAKKFEDEQVKKEVEQILKEIEKGRNEISKKAREIADDCVRAHYETMSKLNIHHNYAPYESDVIHHLFGEGMEKIKHLPNVYVGKEEFEGCYVVNLEGNEFKNNRNTETVLIRSNGVPTYAGKDIIFHMWKLGMLKNELPFKKWFTQSNKIDLEYSCDGGKLKAPKSDIIVNIIGREQDLEQKVVKYVLSKIDEDIVDNYHHLSYGLVSLSQGKKFSGREGTWIGYSVDDVFEEGLKRAKENGENAEKIVVGALNYSLLKYAPQKDIEFDWDRALQFEGDSSPYIQYAYVRCMGILRKIDKKSEIKGTYKFNDEEILILNNLMEFESVADKAAHSFKPNELVNYMLNLVSVFNRFYDNCRIIDEGKINPVRLKIVEKTVHVLGTTMGLCGIPKIEKM
ncbi:arginine--tRNA ligase [Candidatus Micrarchaeota archaeon]|nr:arginine--tRNA ligase [Candidatus Micrarchaeota archaeon]